MVNDNDQLEGGDGLFIDLKYRGDQAVATEAMRYGIDEDGEEYEEEPSISEAMEEWENPIREGHGIDGVLAVFCSDKVWRKLVWFNESGKGQAFQK